jgi:lipoprotein-anchoring transpeptidase ErfK/SrfK
MRSSALEPKTVQPGIMRYSFYASSKRLPAKPVKPAKSGHKFRRLCFVLAILLCIGGGAAFAFKPTHIVTQKYIKTAPATFNLKKTTPTPLSAAAPAAATTAVNNCAGNSLNQLILVSISQRHLWACQGTQELYNSSVVTGIEYLVADTTPVGTYHIYGKYTGTSLKGCDTTGCWNDFVNYWMPFLHNQYGSYGLHDATWRSPSDFGNISPDSADASHGCVELPLATAQWLYNWSAIGTTVTIES